MSKHAITRRSFLARSGAAAALAAGGGFVSFNAWEQAHADEAGGGQETTAHSLCNSCSSKCGFTGYVTDGRLGKMIGDPDHPYCEGTLCARGYGYAAIAYSEDRLTDPLKKNEAGEFEAISWEQAFQEISEKLLSIIDESGPEAISLVHDPRPSGSFYCPRFMTALGSPNVYTHGASCNLSKTSGFMQAIGAGDYSSDIENAKMVLFIGRSYADGIRPSSVHAMMKGHDNGCHVVIVDPRCNNSIHFADEWVPIKPGTDLALVLAMANVLVSQGTYAKEYVEANAIGYEDWFAKLPQYTPEWAEGITGIPADTITRLANELWEAAPASSIEQSWRAAFGCAYQNSGETGRAICLFNTLLGCWGEKGGAIFYGGAAAGPLDPQKFPAPPAVEGKKVGSDEYPLAAASMGTCLAAAEAALDGKMRAMITYQSNMAAGYSNPAHLAECFDAMDLVVAIDVQMSETCMCADYVLPDTSYLERLEVPEFVGGKVPVVSLRDRVIEKVHPNTKPVDEIFSGLAEACGVGEYFNFTIDELADAQLQTLGLSLAELQEKGTITFPDIKVVYGPKTKWNTPTGKIQFTSDACAAAGLPASPEWLEPRVTPGDGEFRLIGGKQAIHTHTQTANIEPLMEITKKYGLDRIWMNADVAAQMGIEENDEVEVSSSEFTGTTRVHVTQRIEPTSIYLPSHYGCSSPDQRTAYGVGLRQMDFVPFGIEPVYGGACTQETIVTVKKVGA